MQNWHKNLLHCLLLPHIASVKFFMCMSSDYLLSIPSNCVKQIINKLYHQHELNRICFYYFCQNMRLLWGNSNLLDVFHCDFVVGSIQDLQSKKLNREKTQRMNIKKAVQPPLFCFQYCVLLFKSPHKILHILLTYLLGKFNDGCVLNLFMWSYVHLQIYQWYQTCRDKKENLFIHLIMIRPWTGSS